jgi:uncharacterized protein
MPKHLMLVPSSGCPAACTYCFGPHEPGPMMSRETLNAIVEWQRESDNKRTLNITFHGGEPLVPGAAFYKMALPLLRKGLAPRKVRFTIQSNLWLLTDELCEIFTEHGVSIGTSLDGPEKINDAQRGQGYYRRTMAGIELARSQGLDVGCICTFTAQSALHATEIFDFFVHEGLNFTVHAALPSIRYTQDVNWTLNADAHGELLDTLLRRYLDNLDRVRIGTLDSLCRSVSAHHGGICTFGDCLGDYLAIGPCGEIYPCQRFVGLPEYQLGTVYEKPSLETLAASPTWKILKEREERISIECGDCSYLDFCRGGCPYNAFAANGHDFNKTIRDPHCSAYQQIFRSITDQALEEVFSQENMEAVVSGVDPEGGLLQRGRLLTLMRGGPHPAETTHYARKVIAAWLLGRFGHPQIAADEYIRMGLSTNPQKTQASFARMYNELTGPVVGLNNFYLHMTFSCNLHCTHCYADANPDADVYYPVENIPALAREVAGLGFRHLVITGGEPLIHPERDNMLDLLSSVRKGVKPLLTVLRTNLVMPLDDQLLTKVASSTDEVVVSVDGNQETHDARRGDGSFQKTIANLRRLVASGGSSSVSIATVLPSTDLHGAPGQAVKALAKELKIKRIRFRPLLPLGRAREMEIVQEHIHGHVDPRNLIENGFFPAKSCGIGQNLYVQPDGRAFPCYAWHGEGLCLGSISTDGLQEIIRSERFIDLSKHTVNSNEQCKTCSFRYLCGGACRAWNWKAGISAGLDARPENCNALMGRAESLLQAAEEYLNVKVG